MKMMLKILDSIFRHARSAAARRGTPLRADKLRTDDADGKPWMTAFGKLRHLHNETARINRTIEEEFEQIESENPLF